MFIASAMAESLTHCIVIFAVVGLLVLNALSFYSRRLTFFSDIIWVLLLGLIYSSIAHFTDYGLPELPLKPDIVLYAFVPLLIFASTQKICLHHFSKVLAPSSLAASVGILISMMLFALPLHFFANVGWLESLLLGIILSATDPLAVGALLSGNDDVPETQKLLIEGESILNDGFVVTVAGILSVLIFSGSDFSLLDSVGTLLKNILGAGLLGIIFGRLGRFLLARWHEKHFSLTINMTLVLAYGSFSLAELFHLSGILAVFASALSYGYKPNKSDHNKHVHRHIWEYFEYIANTSLFFLLGASFFVYFRIEDISWLLVIMMVFFLALPRLLSLLCLQPFLKLDGEKLGRKQLWLMNFAGARGAVSIALILLLPDSFANKQLFLTIAFVMIFLSLLIYPVCMRRVLKS